MIDPGNIGFVDYRRLCPELEEISNSFPQIKQEYEANKHLLKWSTMHWDIGYSGSNQGIADVGWNTSVLLGDVFTEKDREMWKGKNISTRRENKTVIFENADLLPTLRDILIETNSTTRAALTSLEPSKELPWHKDWDPCPPDSVVIRILWGLDVPVEKDKNCFMEIKTTSGLQHEVFEDNKPFMFWSQCNHRVVNNLTKKRIVVGFDVIKPIKEVLQSL